MYQDIVIIIPALNPSENLISYIKNLIDRGLKNILLVDDGSVESKKFVFDSLDELSEVTIFRHAVNLGFNYILVHQKNSILGVITADSDGQHTIEDIIKLKNILESQTEPALILGTRDFSGKDVPLKSKYGNKITSIVFYALYGIKIGDTQTGLRAIPEEYLSEYCTLEGEHFEYEMNMLIHGVRRGQKIVPCIINTLYFDKNSETHFRPLIDSLKIYRVIFKDFFKYIVSSVSAAGIDLAVFKIILMIMDGMNSFLKIIFSTIIARIISSAWNFTINREFVFRSMGNIHRQVCKYYILCIFQMFLSAAMVVALDYLLSGDELIEKMIVDSVLFFFRFQIQKFYIFTKMKDK